MCILLPVPKNLDILGELPNRYCGYNTSVVPVLDCHFSQKYLSNILPESHRRDRSNPISSKQFIERTSTNRKKFDGYVTKTDYLNDVASYEINPIDILIPSSLYPHLFYLGGYVESYYSFPFCN